MVDVDTSFDEISEKADMLMSEFKEFITRGNVIDLAVGTIMGGAFGAIVSSIVNDIITPIIGLAMPSHGLKESFMLLRCPKDGMCEFDSIKSATEAGAITLNWGAFAQAVLSFLIISICIFLMLKVYAKASMKLKLEKRRKTLLQDLPRLCQFCDVEVSKRATRCPHCTSEIGKYQSEAKKTK